MGGNPVKFTVCQKFLLLNKYCCFLNCRKRLSGRKKALQQSTSIPEAEKIKIQALITTDYMSSEYTVSEDSECPSPGGSDNSDAECSKGPKEFTVHKLPWRSGAANKIMGSLDKRVKKTPWH